MSWRFFFAPPNTRKFLFAPPTVEAVPIWAGYLYAIVDNAKPEHQRQLPPAYRKMMLDLFEATYVMPRIGYLLEDGTNSNLPPRSAWLESFLQVLEAANTGSMVNEAEYVLSLCSVPPNVVLRVKPIPLPNDLLVNGEARGSPPRVVSRLDDPEVFLSRIVVACCEGRSVDLLSFVRQFGVKRFPNGRDISHISLGKYSCVVLASKKVPQEELRAMHKIANFCEKHFEHFQLVSKLKTIVTPSLYVSTECLGELVEDESEGRISAVPLSNGYSYITFKNVCYAQYFYFQHYKSFEGNMFVRLVDGHEQSELLADSLGLQDGVWYMCYVDDGTLTRNYTHLCAWRKDGFDGFTPHHQTKDLEEARKWCREVGFKGSPRKFYCYVRLSDGTRIYDSDASLSREDDTVFFVGTTMTAAQAEAWRLGEPCIFDDAGGYVATPGDVEEKLASYRYCYTVIDSGERILQNSPAVLLEDDDNDFLYNGRTDCNNLALEWFNQRKRHKISVDRAANTAEVGQMNGNDADDASVSTTASQVVSESAEVGQMNGNDADDASVSTTASQVVSEFIDKLARELEEVRKDNLEMEKKLNSESRKLKAVSEDRRYAFKRIDGLVQNNKEHMEEMRGKLNSKAQELKSVLEEKKRAESAMRGKLKRKAQELKSAESAIGQLKQEIERLRLSDGSSSNHATGDSGDLFSEEYVSRLTSGIEKLLREKSGATAGGGDLLSEGNIPILAGEIAAHMKDYLIRESIAGGAATAPGAWSLSEDNSSRLAADIASRINVTEDCEALLDKAVKELKSEMNSRVPELAKAVAGLLTTNGDVMTEIVKSLTELMKSVDRNYDKISQTAKSIDALPNDQDVVVSAKEAIRPLLEKFEEEGGYSIDRIDGATLSQREDVRLMNIEKKLLPNIVEAIEKKLVELANKKATEKFVEALVAKARSAFSSCLRDKLAEDVDSLFRQTEELTDMLGSKMRDVSGSVAELLTQEGAADTSIDSIVERLKELQEALKSGEGDISDKCNAMSELKDEVERMKTDLEEKREELSLAKKSMTEKDKKIMEKIAEVSKLTEQLLEAANKAASLEDRLKDAISGQWSDEEVKMLKKAIPTGLEVTDIDWTAVQVKIPGKTSTQCRNYYLEKIVNDVRRSRRRTRLLDGGDGKSANGGADTSGNGSQGGKPNLGQGGNTGKRSSKKRKNVGEENARSKNKKKNVGGASTRQHVSLGSNIGNVRDGEAGEGEGGDGRNNSKRKRWDSGEEIILINCVKEGMTPSEVMVALGDKLGNPTKQQLKDKLTALKKAGKESCKVKEKAIALKKAGKESCKVKEKATANKRKKN